MDWPAFCIGQTYACALQQYGTELSYKALILCLCLSVYWYPAVLNCPHVDAGKKCKSQASTGSRKEAMRLSASISVLRVATRCGSLFGLLTHRLKGRLSWRSRHSWQAHARPASLSAGLVDRGARRMLHRPRRERAALGNLYFEDEPGRRSAAKLLTRARATRRGALRPMSLSCRSCRGVRAA